eukprot:m.428357 g.428357  ORF g.428357 m.428357 type:complete len:353 (-) comp21377_c1_seq10:515-1573(-)
MGDIHFSAISTSMGIDLTGNSVQKDAQPPTIMIGDRPRTDSGVSRVTNLIRRPIPESLSRVTVFVLGVALAMGIAAAVYPQILYAENYVEEHNITSSQSTEGAYAKVQIGLFHIRETVNNDGTRSTHTLSFDCSHAIPSQDALSCIPERRCTSWKSMLILAVLSNALALALALYLWRFPRSLDSSTPGVNDMTHVLRKYPTHRWGVACGHGLTTIHVGCVTAIVAAAGYAVVWGLILEVQKNEPIDSPCGFHHVDLPNNFTAAHPNTVPVVTSLSVCFYLLVAASLCCAVAAYTVLKRSSGGVVYTLGDLLMPASASELGYVSAHGQFVPMSNHQQQQFDPITGEATGNIYE